jgi:hypothetical protein
MNGLQKPIEGQVFILDGCKPGVARKIVKVRKAITFAILARGVYWHLRKD